MEVMVQMHLKMSFALVIQETLVIQEIHGPMQNELNEITFELTKLMILFS